MHCWLWLSLTLVPLESGATSTPIEVRSYSVGSWLVIETSNFRIYSRLVEHEAMELAGLCESHRAALQGVWLEHSKVAAWTPKCDVYLHPSSSDYNRALGHVGDRSFGSTRTSFKAGAPSIRTGPIASSGCDTVSTVSVCAG